MLKYWLLLYTAIAFEVCGTMCMKFSNGFSRLLPSILIFVFYGISFASMSVAVRKIDVGVAYAIWSGVGIVSVVSLSCIFLGETITMFKAFSLLIIIAGVICLNFAGNS
ncbi:MAG: DMT family transporter [Desulfovibrio sp.]|uniref:DMT family transporter n=1 Tax=Desulfovibrio sp. 7SRBS1 TaxID=3378064 RepID=UPI003B3F9A3A